jgi:hypothetical protein
MKNSITFTDTIGIEPEYFPKPATEFTPAWYKKMESYITGKKEVLKDGVQPATVKRCMPVFDAATAGYIIPTYVDVYVRQEDGAPYYSWSSLSPISFHSPEQFKEHPRQEGLAAPKWQNPWGIKVPKGYSVMILPPMHNPNGIFEILPGIVDCDEYTSPVNFPFMLSDSKFEGMIPAGTPLAQIIPFKREKWQMEIGGEKERQEIALITRKLSTRFFDRYKTMFRTIKEYK